MRGTNNIGDSFSFMMDEDHRPIVAAFDFDGTLTKTESLLEFLYFTRSPIVVVWKALGLLPQFILYGLGILPRQMMKEYILARFFGGQKIFNLIPKAEEFAKRRIPLMLRPEALNRLRWHQQQGHRCILISASISLYLEPWAKEMGFDEVICSELQITRSGEITGCLFGLNCWGPEKVRRLDEVLGDRESYSLWAYGDSAGDHDLLTYADRPFYRRFPTDEIDPFGRGKHE